MLACSASVILPAQKGMSTTATCPCFLSSHLLMLPLCNFWVYCASLDYTLCVVCCWYPCRFSFHNSTIVCVCVCVCVCVYVPRLVPFGSLGHSWRRWHECWQKDDRHGWNQEVPHPSSELRYPSLSCSVTLDCTGRAQVHLEKQLGIKIVL